MILAPILLCIASLVSLARAALPASGGPYLIQNLQTGFVFDDFDAATSASTSPPGNPIHGFTVNTGFPQAQQCYLQQTGLAGASGIYSITVPLLGIGIYVNGPPTVPGNVLNAQNFTTLFNVTELGPGANVFTITYIGTKFAVTSPTVAMTNLTLQPLTISNKLQLWFFNPQPIVSATIARPGAGGNQTLARPS